MSFRKTWLPDYDSSDHLMFCFLIDLSLSVRQSVDVSLFVSFFFYRCLSIILLFSLFLSLTLFIPLSLPPSPFLFLSIQCASLSAAQLARFVPTKMVVHNVSAKPAATTCPTNLWVLNGNNLMMNPSLVPRHRFFLRNTKREKRENH